MSSPATSHPPRFTRPDDEVLVRVEGVSKKFCRSLKKSLWYGVCDIASELNPFGRNTGQSTAYNSLTTEDTESSEGGAGLRLSGPAGSAFSNLTTSELARDSENTSLIRSANAPRSSEEQSDSKALDSRPSTLDSRLSTLDSAQGLRPGEFFAVKDVSFELRRGELRTLGQSEKEVSKKCLGATKVPDSGRRRHQCLGLIGHNGAGNQAAGQPLGRLPKAARRVRRRGKARINMTLLKMLNGLIKPDAGSITMRGRVGALIALGAGFNSILTTQN